MPNAMALGVSNESFKEVSSILGTHESAPLRVVEGHDSGALWMEGTAEEGLLEDGVSKGFASGQRIMSGAIDLDGKGPPPAGGRRGIAAREVNDVARQRLEDLRTHGRPLQVGEHRARVLLER